MRRENERGNRLQSRILGYRRLSLKSLITSLRKDGKEWTRNHSYDFDSAMAELME